MPEQTTETLVICYLCREEGSLEDITTFESRRYCEECYNEEVTTCEACGEPSCRYDTLTIQTGRHTSQWCSQCAEYEAFICDECVGRFSFLHRSDIENECVCADCCDEYYRWCEECEEYERIANTCNGEMHAYNYKPRFSFHKGAGIDKHPNLYLGMELEIAGSPRRVADMIKDTLSDDTYLKSDNSILGEGLEIVSHPATLEVWHSRTSNWQKLLTELCNAKGIASGDSYNAGLHVHLSRRPFTSRILYHFLKLLYGYPEFAQHISGRRISLKDHRYARLGITNHVTLAKQAIRGTRSARMAAINLTNSTTVEVRVFSGSFNFERVYGCLEYCDAAFAFSASQKTAKTITPTIFTRYVQDQGNRYSNLTTILAGATV